MNLHNRAFENPWNHLALELIFLRQEINTLPRCKWKHAHLSRQRLIEMELSLKFIFLLWIWICHAFIIRFASPFFHFYLEFP